MFENIGEFIVQGFFIAFGFFLFYYIGSYVLIGFLFLWKEITQPEKKEIKRISGKPEIIETEKEDKESLRVVSQTDCPTMQRYIKVWNKEVLKSKKQSEDTASRSEAYWDIIGFCFLISIPILVLLFLSSH